METKKHSYLAVVNGKQKYMKVGGRLNVPAGSENNFNVFAYNDQEALSEARKHLREMGLKERSFKGVILLKNN